MQAVALQRSDCGTFFLHSDHLGSVSAATNASGALVGMQHYDPWGRVRTGGIGLTARNFTGQRLDATGLLYYHARYYDPTLGRFISPDRLVPEPGDPQSLNRYAYVHNNPLKYTDPTGHWIESAVDIAFIADDIWDITQNGLTWDNGLALAADVGGLLLPGLTGLGMAVRGGRAAVEAASHSDEVVDAARAVAKAADHADDAADAARAAEQVEDAAPSALSEATQSVRSIGYIDPSKVRFSQSSINYRFKDRTMGTIDDLAEGLRSGKIAPSDIPPIRVLEINGQLFTLDNRRLEAFRRAGVDIPYRYATPEEIARERWKFTTTNEGMTILVRGEP